jgi:hypothetical protein
MKLDLEKILSFQKTTTKEKKATNSPKTESGDSDIISFPPFLPVDNISFGEKTVNVEFTESVQSLQFLNSSLQALLKSNILIFLK